MFHNDIKLNNLDKARELLLNIYGELSLNPNIQEEDNLLLADVSLALIALKNHTSFTATSENQKKYDNEEAILAFIEQRKVRISRVVVRLNAAKDDSTIEVDEKQSNQSFLAKFSNIFHKPKIISSQAALQKFVNLLYKTPMEFKLEDKKEEKVDSIKSATIYKAKNGELAVRLPNSTLRDAFLKTVGQGQIEEKFRNSPQFEKNPEGFTPKVYQSNTQCVYCSSYKAQNGEFAINLTSKTIRDKFIAELGLVAGEPEPQENGQIKTPYAGGFFTIYDSGPDYHGTPQDSAIYFSSNNPIFNTPGSYLKIQNGIIHQGITALSESTNSLALQQRF